MLFCFVLFCFVLFFTYPKGQMSRGVPIHNGLGPPISNTSLKDTNEKGLPFSFFFLIRYFPHLHFQCYPKSPPYPPPTPLTTHSPFLALAFPCTGAYKVCKSNGLLFPVMAD
jgi:hypothetical protein